MAVCPQCGGAVKDKARFCTACGAIQPPPASMRRRPAPAPPPEDAATVAEPVPAARLRAGPEPPKDEPPAVPPPPPSDGGRVFAWTRSAKGEVRPVVEPAVADAPADAPGAPAPESGSGAASDEAAAAESSEGPVTLPPAPDPWPFRRQTGEWAAKVNASLAGKGPPTAFTALLARMVRGALLEREVYREAAGTPAMHKEAWQAAAIVIALSSAGPSLAGVLRGYGMPAVMPLVGTCVIQLVAWFARAWLVHVAAANWLKSPVAFRPVFRALAFAQVPAVLQIVPTVGQLVGLWCLVTTTAAIRDVTGSDTVKAAILAVVGVVGVMLATSFAAPVVNSLVRMF